MDLISSLWVWLGDLGIPAALTLILLVSTFLEKIFNVKLIGRWFFSLIGKIILFFFNWFMTPFKPYVKSLQDFVNHSERLEDRFKEISAKDEEREAKRDNQFTTIFNTLGDIKNEVTLNGGKSLKDSVIRLEKHNDQKWEVLHEVREFMRIANLRLDIADEADKRMTFRLNTSGTCFMVSDMFLRFFGYTLHDMVGSDWEFCIAERSLVEVRDKWKKAFARKQPYRCDQFIIDSDGVEHYCRVKGYPMVVDGELLWFFGTVEILDLEVPNN